LDEKLSDKKNRQGPQPGRGKLAARFRSLNILIFTAAVCIMAAVMMALLNGFIQKVSSEYPAMYARSSSEALSAHITRELGLVSMIAHSDAIMEWMNDEDNAEKRDRAFREMAAIVGELYSFNLYVGLEKSRNEYQVETGYTPGDIELIDILDRSNPNDEWYFTCMDSDEDYILEIGIDDFMQRKRVFLNYKVISDGVPLGVFATGLEFSHVAGELFSHYDRNGMRGLIIDEKGDILMDSSLMSDREFLFSGFGENVSDVFTDTEFLSTLKTYLGNIDGYLREAGTHTSMMLSSGQYRYATIMPIRSSNWSIMILSGGISLFNISYFIPMLVVLLALLIVIALVISTVNYRLIFQPLKKMNVSLAGLRENLEGQIFGAERDDELGELSKTIQDLFTIANKDALTGIYNRRFMENNLEHIMGMLSRTESRLSVLMLDIDFFKRYNDTYGHDQGDVCLRKVAGTLADTIGRASDFVARYGGEEFIAILTNTDEAGACLIADKMLKAVQELKIPHAKYDEGIVTISIGITTGCPNYTQGWNEYIEKADEALYKSKHNGRNRCTFLALQGVTNGTQRN